MVSCKLLFYKCKQYSLAGVPITVLGFAVRVDHFTIVSLGCNLQKSKNLTLIFTLSNSVNMNSANYLPPV